MSLLELLTSGTGRLRVLGDGVRADVVLLDRRLVLLRGEHPGDGDGRGVLIRGTVFPTIKFGFLIS